MSLDLDDTIVAIASAPGGAARGVVRLSGARSAACVARLFEPTHATTAPSVVTGQLTLPRGLGQIPARLYLWPGRRSYTRQPAAELHTLGSPPILEAVVESLCTAGARLARPGEFTLRAFLAGRLDLTQAEAVLGVIDARGQAQLDTALAQLAGGLAGPLAALRSRLLDLLAHLEAGLDFADEDIEFITPDALAAQLSAAAGEVTRLAERMRSRRDTSELPRVVLVGPPNAGKSSLLNALAGRNAAIVSEIAGTTRDYVTCQLVAEEQEFLLVDTAGQIDVHGESPLEGLALATTARQRREADVTVFCCEAGAFRFTHAPYDDCGSNSAIQVWTKCDVRQPPPDAPGIRTSSRTGAGLGELTRAIAARLHERTADAVVASTAARCGESLELAGVALARARDLVARRGGEELVAAEVRTALDGLGQVAGAVYTDDVLDRVFGKFCIGK
ncbi:MAG: tRNA modification GTPase [Planctomycetaceae bacterium]|nr:tRNA modification GTPase [Planctomycetaceae bacterium]